MIFYIRLCYVSGLLALVRDCGSVRAFLFSFNLHTLPFFGSPYMVNGIVYNSCGCQIADILNCDFKGIFVMRDTKEEI